MTTPSPGNYSCVSYEDVVEYLNTCNAIEICATQGKIEENLELAQEFLEGLLASRLCPYSECKQFLGDDSCYIFWHFRDSDPLIEAVTVSLNDVELEEDTFELAEHSIKLLDKKIKCTDTVDICGVWGVPVSKSLKRAIILLALEYTQPGISGMQATDTGVDRVTWSDFSIEYSNSEPGHSTGFREVDRLLSAAMPSLKSINFTTIGNSCRKCQKSVCRCET